MKKVSIYTDGACSGNPGPGGWGAILLYGPHEKAINGFSEHTTNNRMELFAAIEALGMLKQPCSVDLYTDSAYLCNAFNQGWLVAWERNGWKNSKKQPVENADLWRMLLNLCAEHDVRWHKVPGHADNEYNNRCDALARAAISEYRAKARAEQ